MPQYDAFLSYARADDTLPDGSRADYDTADAFLRRLYDALTKAGLTIWWDRECLPSQTTPFSAEIERGLRESARVVLIVGPGAAASPWVQAEVREALRQCKAITPLLYKGDFDLIPGALELVSQIDARPPRDFQQAVDDVVRELRREDRLGTPYGVRALPGFYLPREGPYEAARAALVQDAISATVISAPARAAAIYGMGGVGKSTLATALAGDCSLRRHFKDGILWIEVGQNPTVQTLQAAIGVTLGDDRDRYQNSPAEARIALSQMLHQHQALIVLDDVWDHRLIDDFPVSGTACRLLVTTRSGALATAIQGTDIRLDLLSEAEGAALLAGTAGGAVDDPAYRQLSAALGGHTLALALAAARLKKRGPAYARSILDGLDDPTNPFTTLAVHAEDKDLNVEKSLWQSYRTLDPDQQRRFRLLGVLARDGSFELKLAAALWGETEAAADRPLEDLLDADLVQTATEGRYQQHRLLHAYARALLHREGEYDSAFGRYADWVIAFSEQFETLPPEQWGGLEPDLPQVHEVGDALAKLTATDEVAWQRRLNFAKNVIRYLAKRRQGRQLEWLEMGLKAASRLADNLPEDTENYSYQANFLNELGVGYSHLGENQKALGFYGEALLLQKAIGDQSSEAITLSNIGLVWNTLGEKHKALDYYEQALALLRKVGNQSVEGTVLNNMGGVWNGFGEHHKALNYYEQALALRQVVGDHSGEAITLNNIGSLWRDLGEKQKALYYHEQALLMLQADGDHNAEAATLHNIGMIWNDLGEKQKGLNYYEQALQLKRVTGNRAGEAATLHNIGLVWSDLGDKQKALRYYEQALTLATAVGDSSGIASVLSSIGGELSEMGEKKKALKYYKQALPLRRAVGDRNGEAATLNNIGMIYDNRGEKRKALEYYKQALSLFHIVENRSGEAITLNNIGLVWYSLGKNRKALEYYEQALSLQQAIKDQSGEATTLNNMAGIYCRNGKLELATKSFQKIIGIVQQLGAVTQEALYRYNLATTLSLMGNTPEAIAQVEQALALLRSHGLRQAAGGATLEQMEAFLAGLRG